MAGGVMRSMPSLARHAVRPLAAARLTRLVIVGDIHGLWDEKDNESLRLLQPDCVLFVGDFGNEDLDVVKRVAALGRDLPVAAVLGNHDAWDTTICQVPGQEHLKPPHESSRADGQILQEQLGVLGDLHVGFARRDLPVGVSVVGGRPCSWGGSDWHQLFGAPASVYARFFNLRSFEESSRRIAAAAAAAPAGQALAFLAHNGPTGLGAERTALVGKDFGGPGGGDHGDPDLAEAVLRAAAGGRRVPLVAFGHMHDRVDGVAGARRAVVVRQTQGGAAGETTAYVNAAVVPRRRRGASGQVERCFTSVELSEGRVCRVARLWLGESHELAEEKLLFPLTGAL